MLLFCNQTSSASLLGAGVLGDGFGAFRDGVLSQLSGEEESDGGLDLSGGDCGPLVVVSETAGLGGDALEDVVHEGVHDGHGLAGDTGIGVHLLQHFVDVDAVGFPPPPLPLLVSGPYGLSLGRGFLRALARSCFGWHGCCLLVVRNNAVWMKKLLFI